ncbi:MAG TPA: hypothetical protein PLZ15_00505 [Melioribacteraceae bacterium]|nr:hypothetical protein [Melioribacteraceae bacterium]
MANSLAERHVRVSNLSDVKRLLGRIIWLYQQGKISSVKSRDLAYLCSKYIEVCKADKELNELDEITKRINDLEKKYQ